MRRAIHLFALVATAAALVAAAPGRCVADAHHAPPPTEAPGAPPPCHEAPAPTDRPCPVTTDGAVAACCATPAAPVAVRVSVPTPTVAALPALVATWESRATAEAPARPATRAPDRPPTASRALFGCFRI